MITLHPPWWICIGFHTHSTLHTNCVWLCSSACVVLPLLILLTNALVLLWCLVDLLWDLLLMVTFFVHSHRTDWGLRSFAVAGPSSWNILPVCSRSSSFKLETFAKHLKTHLFGLAYSRQSTHFWVCITFCKVRQCHQTRLLLLLWSLLLYLSDCYNKFSEYWIFSIPRSAVKSRQKLEGEKIRGENSI